MTNQYGEPLAAAPSFPAPAILDRNSNIVLRSDSLMRLTRLEVNLWELHISLLNMPVLGLPFDI